MSLQDEGFRFVLQDGLFNWVHPNLIRPESVDCTDMPDKEFNAFVETVLTRSKGESIMSDLPDYDAWKTTEPESDDTQEQCFCGRWYEPVDRNGEKADVCPTCEENAAVATYERFLESYYGGDAPVTIEEQHSAAWEEKRRLR